MNTVINAFQSAARLRREEIFENNFLTPTTALEDANTSACGWVGSAWESGGDVLIGINPGGGGDQYRRNPTDDRLYALLRTFRDSEGQTRGKCLADLSGAWMQIQRGHNIWRLIGPLLDATGRQASQCAFLNVLPFRTRNDKPAPIAVLRRAADLALLPQIEALAPRRVMSRS